MSDSDNDDNDHLNNDEENNEDFNDESDEDDVEFPDEVIIDGVVYGMSDTITELNVREGVTNIPDECCIGCVNLTSVILPASLESIGFRAFRRCESLRNIKLPESLSSIDSSCFWNCSKLESIIIPNSVTTLGFGVLAHCTSLSKVVLPDSLSSIPGQTFYDCKSLKSLVIPDSVTSIDWIAFADCHALTSINIPDSATVDDTAFGGCTKLKAIAASNDMEVEDYFRNSHLKKLHYEKNIKPRVIVLLCLKFINARRMEGGEVGITTKMRGLNTNEEDFNGVMAESKITAFEMWREIIMYL